MWLSSGCGEMKFKMDLRDSFHLLQAFDCLRAFLFDLSATTATSTPTTPPWMTSFGSSASKKGSRGWR